MDITKKTVYEYKGKTFDTKQEASDYAVRGMMIDYLESSISVGGCWDWADVLNELESVGYTITKKGDRS